MNLSDNLIALLRSELCGAELPHEVADAVPTQLDALRALANAHGVSHILTSALIKAGAIKKEDSEYEKFIKLEELAFFSYKRIDYEIKRICSLFDELSIRYLLLKGAVIRDIYPEPWMRLSGDIDILVDEELLDTAVKALCERLGYKTNGKRDYHDISLFSEGGVHLELHFSIKENIQKIDPTLERVWDYASPVGEGARYGLTPEFFALHLITHSAYHFTGGGSVIKQFIDLWLWRERVGYDEKKLGELLSECGMQDFYSACLELIGVWFSGGEHTELTRAMQAHIVTNELCGTSKSYVLGQGREGGYFGYILRRTFPRYSSMIIRYPVLKKHAYLLPFLWVWRWLGFLFSSDKKRIAGELDSSSKITEKQVNAVMSLYKKLGLD